MYHNLNNIIKMSKFILKKNGKEVKIGDILNVTFKKETPVYTCEYSKSMIVDKSLLNKLLDKNIIERVGIRPRRKVFNIYQNAMNNLVRKTGLSEAGLYNSLRVLYKVNNSSVESIILKEIAIEIDKKYSDHIKNSSHIYAISKIDDEIFEVNNGQDLYQTFAAFRSVNDAKTAKDILIAYIRPQFDVQ